MRTVAIGTIALALLGFAFALPPTLDSLCTDEPALSEWYIGEDHNVKVEELDCPGVRANALIARQTGSNVCGAPCTTYCFNPAGGGPDPNECNVIADALRYESQNTGALFPIPSGTNNTIAMTYRTCKTFFVNQDFSELIYCRTEWANLVDYIAFNCQATQNAHGGLCVAGDQRWFVQVARS